MDVPNDGTRIEAPFLRNLPSFNKDNFSNCKGSSCHITNTQPQRYVSVTESPNVKKLETESRGFLINSVRHHTLAEQQRSQNAAQEAANVLQGIKRKHSPEMDSYPAVKHRNPGNAGMR